VTVRIGILGAARIAPAACIRPARAVEGVEVVAVAARDGARARAYAAKHGIPRVHDGYRQLLEDPDIDAVYNPLPNGLHGIWTVRAMEAGKHVLCEKPFTANATEAESVARQVALGNRVVMEAFHYRYHPMMLRALEILESGEIGTLERVDTAMCIPLPMPRDIRYRADLAGGATMDIGCYAVHLWRALAGDEPTVVGARAKSMSPGVDRALSATLRTGEGVRGGLECSLLSSKLLRLHARVIGSRGSLTLFNPLGPQVMNRTTVKVGSSRRIEHAERTPTYNFQMQAFRDAIGSGHPFPTTAGDAVANMEVVDALYRAAGMSPRDPTPAA
jgi:predicted dehydrogenase